MRAQREGRGTLLEARGQEEPTTQQQFGDTDTSGKAGNRNVWDELSDLARDFQAECLK